MTPAASTYLDAIAFTAAFRKRHRNHAEICLGLQLLVRGVAKKFSFDTIDDREDVESEALTYAIRQIPKFNFGKGANAFTYFSSVAFNAIRRELRRRSAATKRAVNFSDLSDAVTGDKLRGARRYFELRGR